MKKKSRKRTAKRARKDLTAKDTKRVKGGVAKVARVGVAKAILQDASLNY
jgi:hypothetical protein